MHASCDLNILLPVLCHTKNIVYGVVKLSKPVSSKLHAGGTASC